MKKLENIVGLESLKRACEIAIVGDLNLLTFGERGIGKKTLKKSIEETFKQKLNSDNREDHKYTISIGDCIEDEEGKERIMVSTYGNYEVTRKGMDSTHFDLFAEGKKPNVHEVIDSIQDRYEAESTEAFKERIIEGKEFHIENSGILYLEEAQEKLLKEYAVKSKINTSRIYKILKVARAIASLELSRGIGIAHIQEAIIFSKI